MAFMRVRGCCCGCSLETGTKILAILSIIGGIFGFAYCINMLFHGSKSEQEMILNGPIWSVLIGFVTNCLLFHGANKRKTCFVLPWLVVEALGLIGILLSIIGFVIGAVISGLNDRHHKGYVDLYLGVAFVLAVVLALNLYFFAVVYSFYRELREQQNLPLQNVPPPSNVIYPVLTTVVTTQQPMTVKS